MVRQWLMFTASLLVVVTTGCGTIPWEDRIYPGDCCECECCHPPGVAPAVQRSIAKGACRGGCGEVYWGEWRSDPPDCCNPCNCGQCGASENCEQCGDCAGCCSRRSGPLTALTTRAVTGGACDSPNCKWHGGHAYDPMPSRAVWRPGEQREFAGRAQFEQPNRPRFSQHQGAYVQRTHSPGPATQRPAQVEHAGYSQPQSPIDQMNWDLLGSEGAPVEARTASRIDEDSRGSFGGTGGRVYR